MCPAPLRGWPRARSPLEPSDLLAALDPEQREVATTLPGPAVRARRRRHRQDPGDHRTGSPTACTAGVYVPQRVLAVTFTARAAGEMRTRLRDLGVGGVQARTFHAAALRQLRYFWPRHVGGELPELVDAQGRRWSPRRPAGCGWPPTGPPCATSPAEIEWAKVTMTDRDDYPAAAAKAGRAPPAGLDPAAVARLLSTYEEVKRDRGVIDFEDVLLLTVGAARRAPPRSPTRCASSTATSSSTSTRTSARCSSACSTCGSATATSSASSATRARPSTPSPARPRTTCSASASGYPARHGGAAGPRLPLHAAGRRPGQPAARRAAPRGPARRRLELVAQRAGRSGARAARARRRAGRGRGGRDARSRDAGRRPARRPREIAVLFRTNGQCETYEQALADAGVPYLLRGGERFFERPEVREAALLLRGAARSRRRPTTLPADACAASCAGGGWTRARPPGGGAVRERWESLAALVRLADDLAAAERGARRCATSSPSSTSGPPPSTRRPSRASRSRRCTPPRAWSGTPCSSSALTEGMCRSPTPRRPRQVEEERRLLYVGVTRAREHLSISWSLARAPGGRAGAAAVPVPRRPARRRPAQPARRLAAPRGAQGPGDLPGLRQAADRRRSRASSGAARTARRPTTRRSSSGCASGAREQAQAAERPGLRRVHRRHPDRDRRGAAHQRARRCSAISGIGRTKLERYGADVLALCAGRSGGRPTGTEDDDSAKVATAVKKMIAPDAGPSLEFSSTGSARRRSRRLERPETEVEVGTVENIETYNVLAVRAVRCRLGCPRHRGGPVDRRARQGTGLSIAMRDQRPPSRAISTSTTALLPISDVVVITALAGIRSWSPPV